jgi:lambda repressor-like predicted transcriptional regulator
MADPIFWRDLATEFEALPKDTVTVQWQHTWGGVRDQCRYEIYPPSELSRFKFEQLARKAGRAFDLARSKDHPLEVWLEQLRRYHTDPRSRVGPSGAEVLPDGTKVYHLYGTVRDAVEASTIRCLQLEMEAEKHLEVRESKPQAKTAAPSPEVTSVSEDTPETRSDRRKAVILPILNKKGWSNLDWATESGVDYHTVNDYFLGKTTPYRSTRKKLAESLELKPEELPE